MCNRMKCEGTGKSATVYFAAAVILTCYLAQTVDCNRLKKTEWRKEADAARRIGFTEGQIVFGRVFEKGSGLGSQVTHRTNKLSSNASVEEDAAYQADSAGWVKGRTPHANSREAAWKRMSPSLQCGWDQLKFRAVGPGALRFAVEQVPSTCGYSMQRNSLALVMLVPYDGCNVVQEVGSYVLLMHWQGSPVSLWCPKPPTPAPTTVQSAATDPLPFYPLQGLPYFFPPYPINPQYPTPEPETTTPMALPEQPQDPFNPRSFNPQYQIPEPGTTTPPPTVPERHRVHFPHYFYNPQYPFYPQHPTLKLETTTTPPPKARPERPHVPRYPFHPQYPTRNLEMTPPPKPCPERPHVYFPRYRFNPQNPTRKLEMTTPPTSRPKRPNVRFAQYPLHPQYHFNP